MFKFIKRHFFRFNILVILVLLLIHFVLKESSFSLSVIYYTFPLPLIIIVVLLLSVFLRKKRRHYNLVLALILITIWLARSFKINTSEDILETDIEIMFWNATHKRELIDVFENNNNNLPDVVVLVEYHAEDIEDDKLKYPNFHFYWHKESEIGVFSKTPIEIKNVAISDDETVVINFTTYNLNFYAVDVDGNMNIYREDQLKFVTETIKTTTNTVVLGDFNTPMESRFLNNIEVDFNQVLNEKGTGFRETWFWNLPLLSLDHIWVSKDMQILNAEKLSTLKSDHSMIKTVIRK
ncbi:endonuclease/exonuclease/phosphatase family protein [Algibacter sp. PT7-4]|uniref:endonuclease/exonuclease/phosphatase family protein n=1 Tax=Algibacter ulvanivorans TaxID=3400999 RepID=UPI003AAFED64